MRTINRWDIPLVLWWGSIVFVLFGVFFTLSVSGGVDSRDYAVRPDGSILYDSGQIAYGQPTYTDWQGNKWLRSDYDIEHGQYLISDNKIWFDNDSYLQISRGTLGYSYSYHFNEVKETVIVKNKPLLTNFKFTHVTKNVITEQHGNILKYYDIVDGRYLAKTTSIWIEDVTGNRTYPDIYFSGAVINLDINQTWLDNSIAPYVIDPSVTFSGVDSWAGTSGTMIEHGDGNLRAPPNLTTNLKSYWSGEAQTGNTLYDVWTANSNDGSFTNGVTGNWYGGGVYGGEISFDGINDYVGMGDVLDMGLSDWSVSAWITTGQGDILSGIAGKQQSAGVVGRYGLYTSLAEPNKIRGVFGASTTVVILCTSSSNITDGIPHYVVVTYDRDGLMSLYFDGVLEDSISISTHSGVDMQSALNFDIGIYRDSDGTPDNYFNGSTDEVRIYNQVLINDEINETRDNYHTNTSYRQIDTANDYGAGQVLKHINITGIDPSANTTMALYVNGSHDNVTFNSWELVNGSCNVGDNVTVPVAYEYRYLGSPGVKVVSNTSYQPETNIIESILLIPAPVYTVSGTIYGANGLGEGQVTVTLGSDSTTTSPSGAYSFTGVYAGTYTLTASKPGLQDATTTITVSSDTTQDLTMARAVSPGGGGQESSDWGLPFNISGSISRLDGLFAPLQVPSDPGKINLFWYFILGFGAFMFIDGTAFRFDKSRNSPVIKMKYRISAPLSFVLMFLGLLYLGFINWNSTFFITTFDWLALSFISAISPILGVSSPLGAVGYVLVGTGILVLGVLFFIDGVAFCVDKSRENTFLKIKYQVLIAAGLGLGVLGAVVSGLVIFS